MGDAMAAITLENITKRFGGIEVIKGIDLEIADHQLTVFVGPSGCGKSTLLRLIAGLEEVSSGTIRIGGERVDHLPPARRGIAMVFQSYALYPHMSVYDNMAFGLRLAHHDKRSIRARVERAAEMLQIAPLLARKPRELSGGQRQRVAIGRAIVREPRVFLFDEPLSNLDAALRVKMRLELAKLQRELSGTMVYVTHDQTEAMTLGHTIVVLNAGRVEQVGDPMALYRRPCNLFVAGFIGSPQMNFLPGRVAAVSPREVTVALPSGGRVCIRGVIGPVAPGDPLTLGIRPEHIVLQPENPLLSGTITEVERLGAESNFYVEVAGTLVTVRGLGDHPLSVGDGAQLGFDGEECHLFDARGTALDIAPG